MVHNSFKPEQWVQISWFLPKFDFTGAISQQLTVHLHPPYAATAIMAYPGGSFQCSEQCAAASGDHGPQKFSRINTYMVVACLTLQPLKAHIVALSPQHFYLPLTLLLTKTQLKILSIIVFHWKIAIMFKVLAKLNRTFELPTYVL